MKSINISRNDNWCIIYSDIEITEDLYEELIMKIISSYKQNTDNSYEINRNVLIFENPDHSQTNKAGFPDGFLHFRFQISVEGADKSSTNNINDFVSYILLRLWHQKIPSVATCQFEELLPLKGGYKSKWSCSPPRDDLKGEIG